jgi:DNA-binding transcriptional LysR family regulator
VTRAAERLNRVQSNVTTRIKQLEESVGVPLFARPPALWSDRRSAKRCWITPSASSTWCRRRARWSPAEPRGRLRIGSMESAAASRLPAPLAEFHQRWPEVRLELSTAPTDAAGQVLHRQARCGAGGRTIDDPPFDATPLFKEELLLVTPRSHRRVRSPGGCQLDTLIVFEQGCAIGAMPSLVRRQDGAGAGAHAGTGFLSCHPGLRGGRGRCGRWCRAR